MGHEGLTRPIGVASRPPHQIGGIQGCRQREDVARLGDGERQIPNGQRAITRTPSAGAGADGHLPAAGSVRGRNGEPTGAWIYYRPSAGGSALHRDGHGCAATTGHQRCARG